MVLSVLKAKCECLDSVRESGVHIRLKKASLQVYEELDEQVQAKFQDYLEERGINGALGEYLLAIADNKEQREYLRWLGEVDEFVKS